MSENDMSVELNESTSSSTIILQSLNYFYLFGVIKTESSYINSEKRFFNRLDDDK